MKLQEENIGKKLLYMGLGNDFFLDMPPKDKQQNKKKFLSALL